MPSPLFCMPEEGRTIMPEEALQAAFDLQHGDVNDVCGREVLRQMLAQVLVSVLVDGGV